jgi:hypothetical protein
MKNQTLLDSILNDYETRPQTSTNEIPREQSLEEFELLTDYILNNNLQSIYDYHELKDKLDKEWVDNQMHATFETNAWQYW